LSLTNISWRGNHNEQRQILMALVFRTIPAKVFRQVSAAERAVFSFIRRIERPPPWLRCRVFCRLGLVGHFQTSWTCRWSKSYLGIAFAITKSRYCRIYIISAASLALCQQNVWRRGCWGNDGCWDIRFSKPWCLLNGFRAILHGDLPALNRHLLM